MNERNSDLFIELREENNKLINDLRFERKLNTILENIRNYSLVLINSCKCDRNEVIFKKFNDLQTNYANLMIEKPIESQMESTAKSNKWIDLYSDNLNQIERQHKNEEKPEIIDLDSNSGHNISNNTNNNSNFRLITELIQQNNSNISNKSGENSRNISIVNNSIQRKNLRKTQITKQFSCNKCDNSFETELDSEIHLNSMHKNIDSYVCNDCNEIFCDKNQLEMHLIQTHQSNNNQTIEAIDDYQSIDIKPEIEVQFSDQSSSQLVAAEEQPITAPEDEQQFQCDFNGCNKWFATKSRLYKHKWSIHSGRKYLCTDCNKVFNNKTNLTQHNRYVHTFVKPFVCPINECNKRFKTKSLLNQHKNFVHFSTTQFQCDWPQCNSAFKTKYECLRHRNTVHSNYKPFVCELSSCQKSFKTSNELKKHSKTHKKHF